MGEEKEIKLRFVKKNSDAWEMDFDKRFLRKPWVVISQLLNTTQQKTMENTPQCSLRFFVYTHYYIEIESYMGEEKEIKLRFVNFPSGI